MDSTDRLQEYTLAQAAQLLGTSKQTIRNHLGNDPAEITRRPVNGQTWIFLSAAALERIRDELQHPAQTEKLTEKEPETAGKFAGKLPDTTEKEAEHPPETTEQDRQAQEIAWLRSQLEEKDRQIAAKDQQIAAAQQLANQAQQLQLVAEQRLIAAGIDPDPEADAQEDGTKTPTMTELREEVQRLQAELASRPRSLWDFFRRREKGR